MLPQMEIKLWGAENYIIIWTIFQPISTYEKQTVKVVSAKCYNMRKKEN